MSGRSSYCHTAPDEDGVTRRPSERDVEGGEGGEEGGREKKRQGGGGKGGEKERGGGGGGRQKMVMSGLANLVNVVCSFLSENDFFGSQ